MFKFQAQSQRHWVPLKAQKTKSRGMALPEVRFRVTTWATAQEHGGLDDGVIGSVEISYRWQHRQKQNKWEGWHPRQWVPHEREGRGLEGCRTDRALLMNWAFIFWSQLSTSWTLLVLWDRVWAGLHPETRIWVPVVDFKGDNPGTCWLRSRNVSSFIASVCAWIGQSLQWTDETQTRWGPLKYTVEQVSELPHPSSKKIGIYSLHSMHNWPRAVPRMLTPWHFHPAQVMGRESPQAESSRHLQ